MNVFDVIIAATLIFGFVRGLMKGLLVEVASLVALIVGVYGAIHFSHFISDYLKDLVSWNEEYVTLAAYAGTFIIIIIVISLIGKLLTKLAKLIALGLLNKILGGIFGLSKIGIILSIAFIFFNKINNTLSFVNKETIDNSILYKPIKKIAPFIFPSIIEVIKTEDITI